MVVIILFVLPIILIVHLQAYNTNLKKNNDYCIGALQTIEYSLQVMTPGMKNFDKIEKTLSAAADEGWTRNTSLKALVQF